MKPLRLPASPQTQEERANILKALAHPSRLTMVEALANTPRCVCDLRELVGGDLSTVSKHLGVLRSAGIVRDERRGTQIFYHLIAPCVLSFFDCLEVTRQHRGATMQANNRRRPR